MMSPPLEQNEKEVQPTTSIDQKQKIDNTAIVTKEEAIASSDRVAILTPSLKGSLNLKGGILDDLILLKYKESLEENSKYINLLSPDQTSNPYYIEIGWKTISNNTLNIELPNLETKWKATSNHLSPSSPVTLHWINNDNVTFKIHFEIEEDNMLSLIHI